MQTEGSIQLIFFIAFAVVASRLVRKGRADPAVSTLGPPSTNTTLGVVCISIPCSRLLSWVHCLRTLCISTVWHVLLGLVGASAGVPIGTTAFQSSVRSCAQAVKQCCADTLQRGVRVDRAADYSPVNRKFGA